MHFPPPVRRGAAPWRCLPVVDPIGVIGARPSSSSASVVAAGNRAAARVGPAAAWTESSVVGAPSIGIWSYFAVDMALAPDWGSKQDGRTRLLSRVVGSAERLAFDHLDVVDASSDRPGVPAGVRSIWRSPLPSPYAVATRAVPCTYR